MIDRLRKGISRLRASAAEKWNRLRHWLISILVKCLEYDWRGRLLDRLYQAQHDNEGAVVASRYARHPGRYRRERR